MIILKNAFHGIWNIDTILTATHHHPHIPINHIKKLLFLLSLSLYFKFSYKILR